MSMDVRKVKLDFNRTFQSNIPSVQGDTGRSIEFQIMNGSLPEDITGETVKIFGLKPDGYRVFNNAKITDARNGKCVVDLTLQMLCVAGIVQCTLVRYKNGEKLSSRKFNIEVAKSVADDIEIESTNEYLALTEALAQVGSGANAEVIASRTFTDGTDVKTFDTLSDRLNHYDKLLIDCTFNMLSSKNFGSIGDNSSDNYTYFNNMFKESAKNIVYDTTINSNRFFTKSIDISPGIYRIKEADLFANAFSVRTQNLVVNGNGCVFVFEGFEGNCFYNNDKILNVDFYNCNFISVSDDSAANRILFASNSSGGAQAIRFHNCNFGGQFKYGVNLTGSNCNSEWIWNSCGFFGAWDSFLYIGQTNTSDQFLNYWFNNCKYWCSSNWITAYKGGHFKFTKCDISGYAPAEETYLFNFLGTNGSQGVQTFIDDGNRYELKSQYAKVLKCNWDMAHITFHESDMSSQAFNTGYVLGDVINIWNGSSGNGAIYKIQNSKILGKIKLSTNNNNLINKMIIENSLLMQTSADTNTDLEKVFDNTNIQGTSNTFAIELYNTKFKNGTYNRTIKPLDFPKAVLNNKVHLNQSNYNKLLSTWSYEIIDPVIVKSISVFNWTQSIGNEYKFMIKTDLTVNIDSVSGGLITLTGSQTLLNIGDKFTIGDSDTVYTVSGQDYVGLKLRATESLGAEAVSGAKISKVFNDIALTPNKSIIRDVYNDPVIVSNKIYLKCYGANTIDANGLNVRVLVETLE